MYHIMKCILVTPVGRERYLSKLYKHIKRQKNEFDVWHLWMNTIIKEDIDYIESLAKSETWIKIIYKDLIKIIPDKGSSCRNLNLFYGDYREPSVIYIKIDDDIVFMETDFIKKLKDFRMSNRNNPIVFPNIINNNYFNDIHKHIKDIDKSLPEREYALQIHKVFKDNPMTDFYFDDIVLNDFKRVGIQCFSWIGNDFPKMFNKLCSDPMRHDDEQWLSFKFPLKVGVPNKVRGDCLCVHYSYNSQQICNEYKRLLDY